MYYCWILISLIGLAQCDRCQYSLDFQQYEGSTHNDYEHITSDECMQKCEEDADCIVGNWFPKDDPWEERDHSLCRLFKKSDHTLKFSDDGDENTEAKLIRCSKKDDIDDIERCFLDERFTRHCGAALRYSYGQSYEHCRQECNDRADCQIAHWHPPYQIWDDEARSVCFLFSENAERCDWGGAELISYHPGAQMIRCKEKIDTEIRCHFSEDLHRQCGEYHSLLYALTAEQCLQKCDESANCITGHWHPPHQIWSDEARTVCFLFKRDDINLHPCPWGDEAKNSAHPGAKMIRCSNKKNGPIERCTMSYDFLRHCGNALKYIYGQSPEYCRQWCNDNKKCHVAHWHPPYSIWGDEARSVCFVFPHGTQSCDWGGAELGDYHKGAHMVRCMYQE
ncbi:uncharacterized protein [Clytia hemisphaerica]|uniref:Apple domain-containing protein n=2 Tax=Clytia hemisphaerica TaxID=252671 RepID=A0A7M5UW61_9CNID